MKRNSLEVTPAEPPRDSKLVGPQHLLNLLFSDDCRPTVNWLYRKSRERLIPSKKIGGKLVFDPAECRAAIDRMARADRRAA